MAQVHLTAAARPTLAQGVVGGLIGGVVYFVFALAITVLTGGVEAIPLPLRQIGAVVLGPEALEPSYDFVTAAVAGNAVHFVLSAVYGGLYAVTARSIGLHSALLLILGGALYGLAIYAANLFVIFPALYPWFLANDPVIQATLHALAFGAVIGAWLARR